MASTLFALIVVFLIVEFIFSNALSYLNANRQSPHLPDELKEFYDAEQYKKSGEYGKASRRFGIVSSIFGFVLLLLMLFFNGFAQLDAWVHGVTQNPILAALLFFGILALVYELLTLPFSIYGTFVIEEKFGFNKTTPGLFVADKLKGLLLSAVMGGAILSALVFFYQKTGGMFWIYAWVLLSAVSLFFASFYTSLLLPLFNKLTPLEDGELRSAIQAYAQKVDFPLTNIFIMDGSKRSSKANAFFSGLGKNKSIVLYDTLVNEQSVDEIVAVLAHEVGHYKKKHIIQGMAISILHTGLLLFLLNFALNSPDLSQALGVAKPNFHIGLLAFSLLYAPINLITGIFMNLFSRKNEYEADGYARETYSAAPLVSALKKMSVNHLSNLTPHPAYVFVYYSHPPLLSRLAALRS